ncbi:M23 family metallopeptidase [Mucilaginibacter myungsuensis]|uniref:M23 family metallopeptidase n=1 Tax=Mucilaginibacter myungsuensis TaxID=649104 RepID=A0A929L5A2_9SPHI|nr:M23 family metallopeptidase [Mucilaginibacter myungsuensis]MBE9664260.1 M23 family metallopeptidase [Mucilaginibacter myungsuensis]MDN3599964.1 M23 family metallopeptidase [Mucilaginibacter myungsuensis]
MTKRIYLFLILAVLTYAATGQDLLSPPSYLQGFSRSKEYPQFIFSYPLEIPPTTAGSFGELRPNHFHSGLDFKTQQRTGIPVHAPAAGFISRLKIQYGGFGQAVYIDHPGGYTTVYGHLDRFTPEILQYIRSEQAKQQKYDVDLYLKPEEMPVYKGQVFAWSGNTGASGGPHLHFEIRDAATQQTINPQLFGLTIPDKVPPTITSVSVYHLNGRPFDENTFRQSYAVRGANGEYSLSQPQTLELSGSIGFGISASDMNSTSFNKNGVYSIELKVDDKTVFTFAVERFGFDQTRGINAYIDLPYQMRTGGFIQKCFVPPGSKATIYPQSVNKGIVTFADTALHNVEYVVKDIAGNTSTVKLKVRSSIAKDRGIFTPKGFLLRYDRHNEFVNDKVKLVVEPNNIYDDLDLMYRTLPKRAGSLSELHGIHNRFTPIHDSLYLYIKPDVDISQLANKVVVTGTVSGAVETDVVDGWVRGKIRSFGDYDIKVDTIPPTISGVNIRNGSNLSKVSRITLRISDGLSGVKNYVGKIDGKWVLVEHDYKSKAFIYTFDGSIGSGKHTFELTATDYKDNVSQFTAEFTR